MKKDVAVFAINLITTASHDRLLSLEILCFLSVVRQDEKFNFWGMSARMCPLSGCLSEDSAAFYYHHALLSVVTLRARAFSTSPFLSIPMSLCISMKSIENDVRFSNALQLIGGLDEQAQLVVRLTIEFLSTWLPY